MFEEHKSEAGYGTFGWQLDEQQQQQQQSQQQQQQQQQQQEQQPREPRQQHHTSNSIALSAGHNQQDAAESTWSDILCAGLPTSLQLTVVAMSVVVVFGRTFGTILDARLAMRFQSYTWFFSSFATPILFTALMWPIVLLRHALGFTDSTLRESMGVSQLSLSFYISYI